MSVVSTTLFHKGRTGSFSENEVKQYVAMYTVRTSDPQDGVQIVYEQYDGPRVGDKYEFGNDRDSRAVCRSVTPEPAAEDSTRTVWRVTALYEAGDVQSERDQNGNPTNSPLKYAWDVEFGSQVTTTPVYTAVLLTDLPTIKRKAGSVGPVVNAAGVVFNPPLEKEDRIGIVRIGFNSLKFNTLDESLCPCINDQQFNLNIPWRFQGIEFQTYIYPAYTVKLASMGGSVQFERGVTFWRNRYEFHIWRRTGSDGKTILGWREEVVNRGFVAAVTGQDEQTEQDNIDEGIAPVKVITDEAGHPVKDYVLLALDGTILPAKGEATYIKYAKYPEVNLNDLQAFRG